MKLFRNKSVLPIPEGYTAESITIESSTCTGEKTIGFYDKTEKKLMFAELVKSGKDIKKFYEKYGLEYKA